MFNQQACYMIRLIKINQKKDNIDNKKKSQSAHSQQKSKNTNKMRPQDIKLPLLPQWIYSTGIVETSFTDGSFKRGLGTLLKNGLYLTSSEIIYNGKIMQKMPRI